MSTAPAHPGSPARPRAVRAKHAKHAPTSGRGPVECQGVGRALESSRWTRMSSDGVSGHMVAARTDDLSVTQPPHVDNVSVFAYAPPMAARAGCRAGFLATRTHLHKLEPVSCAIRGSRSSEYTPRLSRRRVPPTIERRRRVAESV